METLSYRILPLPIKATYGKLLVGGLWARLLLSGFEGNSLRVASLIQGFALYLNEIDLTFFKDFTNLGQMFL